MAVAPAPTSGPLAEPTARRQSELDKPRDGGTMVALLRQFWQDCRLDR